MFISKSVVSESYMFTQGVGHREMLSTSEGCDAGSPVEFQKYAKNAVWICDPFIPAVIFHNTWWNTEINNDGGGLRIDLHPM